MALPSAAAVGGGVLIHPTRQEGEEDTEAQSFVVPVPNGIQLETRHRSQRPDAADDADAEVCQVHDSTSCYQLLLNSMS